MLSPMSGRKKSGSDGRAPGGGGYAKSGKPRPGTGGNRRDRLEGKGPTPPAYMRTGHPAQRAAAARAAGRRPAPRKAEEGRGGGGRDRSENCEEGHGSTRQRRRGRKWSRAVTPWWSRCGRRIPAVALYVPRRAQEDERVAEAVQLAADAGVAVLEAGMSELDRLTGGADAPGRGAAGAAL